MLADNAHAYGGFLAALGRPLDYATAVGLWLNLDRVDNRGVVNAARGVWLSKDSGDLDKSLLDAVCLIEEEVEEALFRANADRQRQRVLRKYGF